MPNISCETLSKSLLLSRPHFPHPTYKRVGENYLCVAFSSKILRFSCYVSTVFPLTVPCSFLIQGAQHVVLSLGVCSLLGHVPASVWEAARIEVCSPGLGDSLPQHNVRSFTSCGVTLSKLHSLPERQFSHLFSRVHDDISFCLKPFLEEWTRSILMRHVAFSVSVNSQS